MNLAIETDESLFTMLEYIQAAEDQLVDLQHRIQSLRALGIKVDYELYLRGKHDTAKNN